MHTLVAKMLRTSGFTLIEVLVTLVILAFGLLALVNLQVKLHMTESESYQRAQAVVLVQDMVNRMRTNPANGAAYVTPTWLGEGGGACAGAAAQADCAAWTDLLLGSAAVLGVEDGGGSVGAMAGARGCVEEVQARNAATGICQPGIYRVTVAWQGLYDGAVPAEACAAGAPYGGDGFRRVVSTLVSLGTPACLPS